METMFSTLLQLPLFQGLSQEDFTNILGKVKLHFAKHSPREVIVSAGTPCRELIFLLQGEMSCITTPPNQLFTLTEKAQGPYLIEPYSLFGMDTAYRSTYRIEAEASTVSIDKSFIMKELFKYEIFRINYSNNICNRVHSIQNRVWNNPPANVADKIIYFILLHIERPEGEKRLKIRMEDLARYVDDTRLNVSGALNEMQDKKLVELNRKEIFIPDAKRLMERE